MSVTAIHLPFKKDFEPIVRPLENVAIARTLDEREWEYYRVKYVEPFFVRYTTASIGAGATLENIKISDLELHELELGQIRIVELTSGFELSVRLPESTNKYTTKKARTRVDSWIVANYPWLTEIFYMGDVIPVFDVTNTTSTAAAATLRIVGFKYVLEKLAERPREFTVIYVSTVIQAR